MKTSTHLESFHVPTHGEYVQWEDLKRALSERGMWDAFSFLFDLHTPIVTIDGEQRVCCYTRDAERLIEILRGD